MKKLPVFLLSAFGILGAHLASAASSYNFNVQYQGNGNATLLAGDNPTATTMFAGDNFNWNIAAAGNAYWEVITSSSYFPLMAFAVLEDDSRTGDFTLTLRLDNAQVFQLSENDSVQQFVHLGTNAVNLNAGLLFDEMHLSYSLKQANLGSTPTGLLPIFGAPEQNQYFPGITYVTGNVPETGSVGVMLIGAGLFGILARRRSCRNKAA